MFGFQGGCGSLGDGARAGESRSWGVMVAVAVAVAVVVVLALALVLALVLVLVLVLLVVLEPYYPWLLLISLLFPLCWM